MADTPNILTPLQHRFLEVFSQTELKKGFFLTGGTALAHFYLQHRFSDDLDFFTEIPGAVARVRPILDSIAIALSGSLKIRREYETFLEIILSTDSDSVLMNTGWLVRLKTYSSLKNCHECSNRSTYPPYNIFSKSKFPV